MKRLTWLALVFLGTFLSACTGPSGGGANVPPGPTDPLTNNLTPEYVSGHKGELRSNVESLVRAIVSPLVSPLTPLSLDGGAQLTTLGAPVALSFAEVRPQTDGTQTCSGGGTIVTTGTTVDDDKDGIPADAKVSINHCVETSDGFSSTTDGYLELKDKNDQNPRAGFTLAADVSETFASGSQSGSFTLKAGADVSPTPAGGYTLSYGLSLKASGGTQSGELSYHFDATLTPDDPAHPEAGGTLEFTGKYGEKITDSSGSQSHVFNVKGSALKFGGSCDGFYSGTITISDGGGNKLVITYTGCGTGTYTYNGSSAGSF